MILTALDRIRDYTERGWWGETTLDDLLRRNVALHPERLAVVDAPNRPAIAGGMARRLDYAALDAWVDGVAAELLARGVSRDDIVLMQMPNIVESLALMLACGRIGAVVSPVAVQYREHELLQIVDKLAPKVFITVSHCGEARLADLAAAFLGSGGHSTQLLVLGDDIPASAAALTVGAGDAGQRARVAAYLAQNRPSANDIFTICWTSGTEAQPKGVPRSHNQWIAIAKVVTTPSSLRGGEVLMDPFPFINMAAIGGMMVPWLLCAGSMVLHHPFDMTVFLGQIEAERVNFNVVPPPILNMLLRQKELLAKFDISSMRAVCSGSMPLAPWMVAGWQSEHNIDIINMYASNEGASLASSIVDVPDAADRASYFPRYGVAGLTWAAGDAITFETRLRDPDSGEIITQPGREGELCIRGACVFDGYFKEPDLTRAAFDEDGYFRTGDMFVIAGEQQIPRYYQFVGRRKEIVIRGGQNISPVEMENLIANHPAVAEVACVGLPDEAMGERLCAVVVLRPGFSLTLEEIKRFLESQKTAIYKWPERLVLTHEPLPRNPVGKVIRGNLRRFVHAQERAETT